MVFSQRLASMKLKDVPSFIRARANKQFIEKQTWGFLNNYNEKYIKTGSIKPLNDVLISVFVLSYAIGWPTEIRHLKHAEEKARKSKKE